jgi:hypothetical protein
VALVTRASTIRAALVAAIEAANPDVRATRSDRFRHLDVGASRADVAPDRTFQLQLVAQPQRLGPSVGCDMFQAEWLCVFTYASSQTGVDDRISDDGERFWVAVELLSDTVTGLARVDVAPQGLSDAVDGVVESSFSIVATYRLAGAVVTG